MKGESDRAEETEEGSIVIAPPPMAVIFGGPLSPFLFRAESGRGDALGPRRTE